MPRLSSREVNRRAFVVYEALSAKPHATAPELARATGVPEDWIRDYMVQVQAGLQGKAHLYAPDMKKTHANGPWVDILIKDLKDDPPATRVEAWRRMQAYGVKCTRQFAPTYLKRWGLPVPPPTRGRGAKGKGINKKLEELKSAVRVLCMQHPDAVPTALIEELIDD